MLFTWMSSPKVLFNPAYDQIWMTILEDGELAIYIYRPSLLDFPFSLPPKEALEKLMWFPAQNLSKIL